MRFFRALMVAVAAFSVGLTMFLIAGWRIPGVAWLADYLTAHITVKTVTTADDMYMGSLFLWVFVLLVLWFVLRGSGGGRVAVDAPGTGRGRE